MHKFEGCFKCLVVHFRENERGFLVGVLVVLPSFIFFNYSICFFRVKNILGVSKLIPMYHLCPETINLQFHLPELTSFKWL